MNSSQAASDPKIQRVSVAITNSYRQQLGHALIPPSDVDLDHHALTRLLYEFPAVVLAHDAADQPTFTYANLAAQRLFEYSWDTFLTLQSQQSAEPDEQATREAMLARALADGYISDYRGIRISASGRRFQIDNATIWNLTDQENRPVGQAAMFDDWRYL